MLKSRGIEFPTSKYNRTDITPSSTLNLTLTLSQLGGDSLTAMHLSNLIQDELAVNISASVLLKQPLLNTFQYVLAFSCPGQTITLDDAALPSQTGYTSSTSTINWDNEINLKFLYISFATLRSSDVVTSCEERGVVVFLTEGTGFVGRFILWELLQSKKCNQVFCLVKKSKGSK